MGTQSLLAPGKCNIFKSTSTVCKGATIFSFKEHDFIIFYHP